MRADVAILGAGLAGAAAASRCAEAGLSTIILEARDRAGGRGFTRKFTGSADLLEFGGGWIAPWHDRIRDHAERTGITLRPTHAINKHRWHDGQMLRSGQPTSEEARTSFERAIAAIRHDALLYKEGKPFPWQGPMTLSRYLDRIGASPEARAHVLAWWTISGNGDPEKIAASEFLASCAYGDGTPASMMTALRHTLVPGTGILAERMIAQAKADLRLNAAVSAVRQDQDGVTLICANGETVSARAAIACLPLNALPAMSFTPGLSERKQRAIALGHGGRSLKLWLKVKNVAPGILASGGPGGLRWLFSERQAADGTTLIVGFALDDGTLLPEDRNSVAAALARFFPEAELVAWDWHDWVNDPYARGTWVALPAEETWIGDAEIWGREGRLAFATSDFAESCAGWFEGAIRSGEAAAQATIELLND
ncbi:flavin monoamine oxidase family protein [Taklimakanibacter lacteus]|uniref:flavin monoamine oxidase family protein n=1 Tax=Taklimakanibacter lacteus TaxID=2268456 RepID=UPI000E66FBF1